jgi:hypothetical protein
MLITRTSCQFTYIYLSPVLQCIYQWQYIRPLLLQATLKMHASIIPLPPGMFSLRTITGEPLFIPNHCE